MSDASAAATRGELLWEPSAEAIERSNLTAYMRWLEAERGLEFDGDYDALWRWSVDELEDFWASIWEYFERPRVGAVRAGPRRAARCRAPSGSRARGSTTPRTCSPASPTTGSRSSTPPSCASSTRSPGASCATQVARAASALRALGVERGDRVVAYMPNLPETLVAFLATASIGAIWSTCSPDFGAGSVVDRFAQIEPKVLFCVDGYRYNGRDFDRRDVVAGLLDEMPTVEHTVVLPYLDADADLVGAAQRDRAGTSCSPPATRASSSSSRCRSTTRSGSSTPPAPPACRRRSSRATAGSCSSS